MQRGISFNDFYPGNYRKGESIFRGAGVYAKFKHLSGSGFDEIAVYEVKPKVPVPGDASPIDAKWEISAESGDSSPDKFTKRQNIQFPIDPLLAGDLLLAKEINNCRRMISYLPEAQKAKWENKILARDAALLGAKGLYKMRHEIWEEARGYLIRESQNYLEEANYNDRIVFVLEWSQWLNDMAWQAAVSILTAPLPFPLSLVLPALMDQMRSFINEYCAAAFNDGTPIGVFCEQYKKKLKDGALEIGLDMGIGQFINFDTIYEKLEPHFPNTLEGKLRALRYACLIVWITALLQFGAYKKKSNDDPYSLLEAAWEATKLLRDQIIVSVLVKNWKNKHGEQSGAAAEPVPKDKKPEQTKDKTGTKTKDETETKPKPKDEDSIKPKKKPADEPEGEGKMKPKAEDKTKPKDEKKPPAPDSVVHPDKPQQPGKHIDRVKKEPLSPETREKAWKEGQQQGKILIDQTKQAIKSGDPQKVRDAVLEMQGDKQGLYEINRHETQGSKDARMKIKGEIKKIYKETDKNTCKELKEQLGDIVRVKEITNKPSPGSPPKDPTKVSYDRDVTFERLARPGEMIPHPKKPGEFIEATGSEWVDIHPEVSAPVYNKHFKDSALSGASPETKAKYKGMSANDFANKMDQTVTFRQSNDSYGRGPSDLNTAVRNPAGQFTDPAVIGKAAEFKANEWYHKAHEAGVTAAQGETFIAEGMRQTTKQFGNQVMGRLEVLNQNRGGLFGPPKIEPPPKLVEAINIMKRVDEKGISPSSVEAQLKALGTSKEAVAHDLGEFMNNIYRMPSKP
ncbi:MAG TPA: hypothetical protein VN328_09910, partial [Thermodesulfovibrionales bacterium]|nr:hypothetical protein [Thermodesulfovibrionales bacterium]